ncbi:MAG: type II toxin-antitoxin system VapC family toxin [Polaromonas sp.]
MVYLLDTNILIYFFKAAGAVRSRLGQQQDTSVTLCAPVLWELLSGTLKSREPQSQLARIEAVKERFSVLPFDLACAEQAAKVRAHLELQGTPIGPVDTMIAGIALANDLTVVTRNTREFSRVPGLRVENWYD